jgi:hypothetical protein
MTPRNSAAVILGAAICLASSSISVAQDQRQISGVGLTIFANRDFGGRSATVRNDIPNLEAIGLNDAVSSLQVAPGEQWEVCEHADYQGRCVVFSGSEVDLRRNGWDNLISSARRLRGRGGVVAPVEPARGSIELFSGPRYQGERRVLTAAEPDLRRVGFNDAPESLRLGPGERWEVCGEVNFRDCRLVDSDLPDLSRIGLSRRISSVRPGPQGGGVGRGRGRGRGRGESQPYIVLYDAPNYRGESLRVDSALDSLPGFTSRAESVQVGGGSWELCGRSTFGRRRCVTVSDDVPDLQSLGMSNSIVSARPVAVPR